MIEASLSSSSSAKCFAKTWCGALFSSAAGSSTGVALSAVVSQRPGYALSVGPARYGVDVNGGICSEMETSGLSETEAIFEAEMLVYTVYIALASEDWLIKSEYKLWTDVSVNSLAWYNGMKMRRAILTRLSGFSSHLEYVLWFFPHIPCASLFPFQSLCELLDDILIDLFDPSRIFQQRRIHDKHHIEHCHIVFIFGIVIVVVVICRFASLRTGHRSTLRRFRWRNQWIRNRCNTSSQIRRYHSFFSLCLIRLLIMTKLSTLPFSTRLLLFLSPLLAPIAILAHKDRPPDQCQIINPNFISPLVPWPGWTE